MADAAAMMALNTSSVRRPSAMIVVVGGVWLRGYRKLRGEVEVKFDRGGSWTLVGKMRLRALRIERGYGCRDINS